MGSIATRSRQRHGNAGKASRTRGTRASSRGHAGSVEVALDGIERQLGDAIVAITMLVAQISAGGDIDDVSELGDVRATLGAVLSDCSGVRVLAEKAVGR
jgi:hypothetical protein